MELQTRKLPVGLQSFEEIRCKGFLYVDKTDLVWQLVNSNIKYNYLSRPRRFGKSVLVDTLECYFSGKKHLFEGLQIMSLEKEWLQRPVIRLDMSCAGATREELESYLSNAFDQYESMYGIDVKPTASLTTRFGNIITAAYMKTGMQVAILIDEYDSPLQHSWKTPHHEECTTVYRSVFAVLKNCDKYEKFVFITGITKFTQISLFSVLNNLCNISFFPEYATLCGITEGEIALNFTPELERMAQANKWTMQQTHDRLKEFYDGYHFSEDNMTDIYNPFSLINALNTRKPGNYWAASGSTSLLPKFVEDMELHLEHFDKCCIDADTLQTSDVTGGGAELFLYQSGYLTIKGYEYGTYILGFPNQEVRQALSKVVMPALTLRSLSDTVSAQSLLRLQMNRGDVEESMKCLKALIADVPYSNKKLASMDMEERYRLVISTILNAIGLRVEVERMLANGRIDIVAWTSRYIYVMELKLKNNGGTAAATRQIASHRYLAPFQGDSRQVIGLALELDDQGKGLTDWLVVEE